MRQDFIGYIAILEENIILKIILSATHMTLTSFPVLCLLLSFKE